VLLTVTDVIASSVLSELLRLNREFRNYVPADKQRPIIVLRDYGDPEYFPPGVKHKYV
jgi:phenylacetate-CoA ligase